ncbi:MAG: hypothetical protein ACP5I4_17350 [Oceanipulchritudo sp.]
MTYKEICKKMTGAGWGSHAVLCQKEIHDPAFDRRGSNFCTEDSIQRLDTYALYQQQGPAPDSSDWVGEPVDFIFYEPKSGGGTIRKKFKAWIYRDKGLVGFINREGKHLLCTLSDVEGKLQKSL